MVLCYARVPSRIKLIRGCQILRLRWLYKQQELERMACLDERNPLYGFLPSMGRFEHSGAHHSFVFADAIDRVVPAAVFNTHTISLNVLAPDTVYVRGEITLQRTPGTRRVSCVEVCPHCFDPSPIPWPLTPSSRAPGNRSARQAATTRDTTTRILKCCAGARPATPGSTMTA